MYNLVIPWETVETVLVILVIHSPRINPWAMNKTR
jgi:hypothetical protein